MLEAICFQTKEVLEAMEADSGVKLNMLKVDGAPWHWPSDGSGRSRPARRQLPAPFQVAGQHR